MDQPRLNKETITNPELWQLYLDIAPDRLDVMIYSPVEDRSMVTATFQLDPAAQDTAKAVEEIVYDNPLLLADFKRATVVYHTDRFSVMPAQLTDSDITDAVMAIYQPEPQPGSETLSNELPGLDATIHFNMPAELYNFLMRTFNCPRVFHHLAPLAIYFHSSNRLGNTNKTFINIRGNRLDIISFTRDTVMTANTFTFRSDLDAVYYTLAARELNGLDPDEHELLISGDRNAREAITPLLRKYVAYVMPVIFPSIMFKAGGQTAMNSPFELIVTPLCE